MTDDDFGPWLPHDGQGCPCLGCYVRAVMEIEPGEYVTCEGIASSVGGYSWDWSFWLTVPAGGDSLCPRVLRYRLRRPSAAMDLLRDIARHPGRKLVDVP